MIKPPVTLWPQFLTVILALAATFSAITPPFQAPDELDHVKRSYMLSRGQILLSSEEGAPSGGNVDKGLLDYMAHFTPMVAKRARKLSADELASAKEVEWNGHSHYQTPSGTAYYLPVMYAPQALGLAAGKSLRMSVDSSYRLSRLLSLLASAALLILAFRIYRPTPALLALLALPMTIFQFGAAVLDPLATATAFVAVAAFMRISRDGVNSPTWMFAALALCTLLVTSCRANMIPLLLLPFAGWWFTRERGHLLSAIGVFVFVLGWTLFTIDSTVYPVEIRQTDHTARLANFITHPTELAAILFNTWSNPVRMSEYWESFIGVLGWLDIPFSPAFYNLLGMLLIATIASCISTSTWKGSALPRLLLILVAVSSILLTFLALLVQWTASGASMVEGVQGRYFLIPAICLLYALTGQWEPRSNIVRAGSHLLLAALVLISAYATASLLVERYYLSLGQPALPAPPLRPSQQLTLTSPVLLHFPDSQRAMPAPVLQLGIRFDVPHINRAGSAIVELWTASGDNQSIPFELSSISDDEYHQFRTDGKPYVGGRIRSLAGEGISVWESRSATDEPTSCLLTQLTDSRTQLTYGCPLP